MREREHNAEATDCCANGSGDCSGGGNGGGREGNSPDGERGSGTALHAAAIGVAAPVHSPQQGTETSPGHLYAGLVPPRGEKGRSYWLHRLLVTAAPVIDALAEGQLRARMPVEAAKGQDRSDCTYLEAFARTVMSLAPWLALEGGDQEERELRQRWRKRTASALAELTHPQSPDYGNFGASGQTLVDTAFLAHAMLRAPGPLWHDLDSAIQQQVVAALKATRVIAPPYCNWLLFSAMVEAALHLAGEDCDWMRIDYALRQHELWYKGDGVYGDGPDFHWDYYNSFVIQPMMLDIIGYMNRACGANWPGAGLVPEAGARAARLADVQERLIAPDGSFPALGRSIAYRCGAFQLLAQLALQEQLPERLAAAPGSVRCALEAVIRRCLEPASTYDARGWLRIGLAGHQPGLGEHYISTGSLYLCTAAFLPLGLAPEHRFWSEPDQPWSAQRLWSGEDMAADHAL